MSAPLVSPQLRITCLFIAALAASCGGGAGGEAQPAAASPVATPPAPPAPSPPSVPQSPAAFAPPFSPAWGSTDPGSRERTIGGFDCFIPSQAPIKSASVGSFRRYTGDCVLSYTISAARMADLKINNRMNEIQAEVGVALSNDYYDHFDWLFIVYDANGNEFGTNPAGQYQSTRSRLNGLPRRLLGAVVMPRVDYLRNGPSLHEIQHEWSNRGALPTAFASHWGASSVGGQLGGFAPGSLRALGGNLYTASAPSDFLWCSAATDDDKRKLLDGRVWHLNANAGNAIGYADLELFMMGLLEAKNVAPIQVAQAYGASASDPSNFTASGVSTWTIDQIKMNLTAAGQILPDYATAQSAYKAAVVVVSDKPRLDDATVRQASAHSRAMGRPANMNAVDDDENCSARLVFTPHNFYSATRGRATLAFGGLSASIRQGNPASLE